jgi:hypothetical protein
LYGVPSSLTNTPLRPLYAIVLLSPEPRPPIFVPTPPVPPIAMPSCVFPSAAVPFAYVPTRLPLTTVLLESWIWIPSVVFAETRFP